MNLAPITEETPLPLVIVPATGVQIGNTNISAGMQLRCPFLASGGVYRQYASLSIIGKDKDDAIHRARMVLNMLTNQRHIERADLKRKRGEDEAEQQQDESTNWDKVVALPKLKREKPVPESERAQREIVMFSKTVKL